MRCPLCSEPVDADDEDVRTVGLYSSGDTMAAHRPCLIRNIYGGFGHFLDHDYWCVELHDPDAGLSYRESALKVDGLIRAEGSVG